MEPTKIATRHRARASAALEIGRYAIAEREARAALAIEPSSVDGSLYLSRSLLGLGKYLDAAQAAKDAVAVAPRDAYAHYLVGFALQVAGKTHEALDALREAVRLQPRSGRYYARLAIALIGTSRAPERASRQHLPWTPTMHSCSTKLRECTGSSGRRSEPRSWPERSLH